MKTFFQELMDEMICYGGMVATRGEVYADAFRVLTHNAAREGYKPREAKAVAHKWADVYAFGPQANRMSAEEIDLRIHHGLRFDPATGEPVRRS